MVLQPHGQKDLEIVLRNGCRLGHDDSSSCAAPVRSLAPVRRHQSLTSGLDQPEHCRWSAVWGVSVRRM